MLEQIVNFKKFKHAKREKEGNKEKRIRFRVQFIGQLLILNVIIGKIGL